MIDRLLDCRRVDFALLFDERRDHAEYKPTLAHIETCAACQQRMETLAASDDWWRACRAHLGTSQLDEPIASVGDSWAAAPSPGSTRVADDLSGVLAPPSHPEMLGRVGRYEVERVLGRGGMGMVFKAFDSELNRPVAIKVLSPHLAGSGTARQRFGREARAAAAVMHEHVVSIHDVDTSGRLPYLVMQYVPGESLQTWVDDHGPPEIRDVVRIGHQIASGLAAAHAQGVVHRDIKPGNIMLENGLGRIVITDFGLAQAADECSLTHTGTLAGTPHYMSPEQANAAPVDHRTDLFSLGSVLYFMATGRTPFRGERAMSVLHHICHTAPTPIRTINADVPAALAALIEALHAKDPRDRIRSAAELRDALAGYLAHLQQPTSVPLPEALRDLQRPARLRRTRVRAGAFCLAAIATACVTAWMVPLDDDGAQQLSGAATDTAGSAAQPEPQTPAAIPSDLQRLEQFDQELARARQDLNHFESSELHRVPETGSPLGVWDRELSEITAAVGGLEDAAF